MHVLRQINKFSPILWVKDKFFGVLHRDDGTARAKMLSNDSTPMCIHEAVWTVQVEICATYAVLAIKNQFLKILAEKGPFFRVRYREEESL